MVFPLAAIGAGFGQFAQDYAQQQAQQRQTLMLQMQLANWQREFEKDRRDAAAAGIVSGFQLPSGAGQQAPIQGLPQGAPGGLAALTGPVPGAGGSPVAGAPGAGSLGEYGGNQSGLATLRQLAHQVAPSVLPPGYSLAETSGFRPGARVAGTGGVSQHALEGPGRGALDLQIIGPDGVPIPNTGEDITGHYGRLALAMRAAAPPDIASVMGWGGNFTTGPANGPRDLMHFDLGGDRGRYGTLAQMARAQAGQGAAQAGAAPAAGGAPTTPEQAGSLARNLTGSLTGTGAVPPGGTQVAQAAPSAASGMPQMPAPPPSRAVLGQIISDDPRYKGMDPRTVGQAVIQIEKGLQEEYKVKLQEYDARLKQWELGPGHQAKRGERIEDLRTTSQIPPREGAKLMRGPDGELRWVEHGGQLPNGGVGWTVAGTGDPETRGRDKVTLENGAVVTGIPGKPNTWTTLYGDPLTPEMRKMLQEGRVQKFGSASSQVNPEVVEGVARGIADYKMAPVTSWAMRSPFGQAVMAKVRELNPEYDQAKYNQRARGLIAFTTGRQGDSVRSFNTSIDHLEVMDDAVQALINGDARLMNTVENYVQRQFGYAAPVDFSFVKNIVGGEVSKAVVGGVGALKDREEVRDGFQLANSPEQLEGVIKRAKQLMAGQLSNYRRQSEATGFPVKDFDAMLSPATRKQLETLYAPGTLGGSAATPAATPGGTGQQPPAGAAMAVPPELASRPDGTGFRDKATGKVWVKRGNQLIETPGAVETPK